MGKANSNFWFWNKNAFTQWTKAYGDILHLCRHIEFYILYDVDI